ncbi:CPBP family intramembrane glutamic endopeptidase [Microbulbifer sp. TRSA007]|uniref:CPBP family intramembrane glutamic endopeptidase n=1 Tax=Microbulbifer sp. TRSA007 TaxID=3243384 RepID=UPI00403A365B
MQASEIALLSIILVFPLADLLLEKYRLKSKSQEYVKTAVILWVITGFLCYCFFGGELSIQAPDGLPASTWKIYFAISIFITFLAYFVYLIYSINNNEHIRQQVLGQLQNGSNSLVDLLPKSRKELLLFTFLVSVTAGVCEELIFRWYLYSFLEQQTNWIVAILGSSMIFGLWHFYLGWRHVLRTAIIGVVFCGVYLYFESIVVAIIAHIIIDVYSGAIAFYAKSNSHHVPIKG